MDSDTGTGRSDTTVETEGDDTLFGDDTADEGRDDPFEDLGDDADDTFAGFGDDDPVDDPSDGPDDGADEPYTGAPSESLDTDIGAMSARSDDHTGTRTAAPGGYDAETGEHVVPGDDSTDEATDDDVADAVDGLDGAGAAGMDALGRGREAMDDAAEELETGDTYTIHPSQDGDVNFANVEGESGEPVVIAQGDSNAAYSSDGDATAGGVNVKDSHHVNAGVELQDSEVYTEAVDELADGDEAIEALFEYAAALDPASDAYEDMTLENGSDVYDEMRAAVDELDPGSVADGYDLGGTELKAVGDLLGTYADRLDAAADTSEADALAEDARDLAGKYQAAAEFAG